MQMTMKKNSFNPGYSEIYSQIGRKHKNKMDAALFKYRPDVTTEQRADTISEIEKLGESVRQGSHSQLLVIE